MDSNHKVIVFCAVSGSGKTTIARKVMELIPKLSFSVSATNRPKRDYEIDRKDYYFLTTEEFKNKVDNGEFLEWEEVYEGRFYGTLKSEVERLTKEDKVTVFDIDVKGAMNIKEMYGENALVIFVDAPIEIIRERLLARGTETEESMKARMDRASEELTYKERCDAVIENIDLEKAVSETKTVIEDFLK